jgi:hypothetical protein
MNSNTKIILRENNGRLVEFETGKEAAIFLWGKDLSKWEVFLHFHRDRLLPEVTALGVMFDKLLGP